MARSHRVRTTWVESIGCSAGSGWHRIDGGPSARFDAVHARLVATQPSNPRVSILHNDVKLDNAMFVAGRPERVSSIFDWDMATLGT